MKAIGLYKYLAIEDSDSLVDVDVAKPEASGHDLLVVVKAISINPVDTKVRAPKDTVEEQPRILGWDAAGEVVAIGSEVSHYQVGDAVYYAGDITRAGSYSEFQLVDERIVGNKPASLNFAEAAALPLTAITAWESLFDRLGISPAGKDAGKSILIIGGAGGVGSIAIQLAKQVAKLTVIATASRPETSDWVKTLGADQVINHRNALDQELESIDISNVDYILCLNNTAQHWQAMANAIAPQGRITSIVETPEPVDLDLLKTKSAGFVWEFMFTRSMFQTNDMIEQKKLLDQLSTLIDGGEIKTTVNTILSPISAATIRQAHAQIETGAAIGKVVLTDWPS